MDKMEIIKKLREETQLGIADCKSALETSNYNYEDAVKLLREKGKTAASKKSNRVTSNGFVGYKRDGNFFAMVEVCCETDFVSRGDTFSNLVDELLDFALKTKVDSLDKLNADTTTVKPKLEEAIAKTGENIKINKFISKEIKDKATFYVHNVSPLKPNLGQIVSVVTYNANADESKLEDMKRVAMHIAATYPRFLNKEDVSADVVEEEKRIYTAQAKESGKPESIIAKMVEGKISKFLEEIVLLEQAFVVDPDKKVKDFIKDLSKDVGTDITIDGFVVERLGN